MDSSIATARSTVIPTMGLLPAPRKPVISTSNPPVGGFGPAAQGLLEQEARLFTKQEAHRKKAVCCAFLPWGHLITSCVHETRCFDLIKHLPALLLRLQERATECVGTRKGLRHQLKPQSTNTLDFWKHKNSGSQFWLPELIRVV